MGAHDLLADLADVGVTVTAEAGRLVICPASKLTDPMRAALREAKPELLALLAPTSAPGVVSDSTPTQTCARCQHLTRIRTCTEPAAAGLDPPPGQHPEADWFGIRWPAVAYGATCSAFKRTT